MARPGYRRLVRLCAVLLGSVCAGCSSSSPHLPSTPDEFADARLSCLGLWYGQFASQNRGKPPKTIEQLRDFGKDRASAEQLAAMGVADVGELFVSPRDGEPYKIVAYDHLPAPGGEPTVVFYEQKGRDGTRRAALLGGGALALDEERFRQLVPDSKR